MRAVAAIVAFAGSLAVAQSGSAQCQASATPQDRQVLVQAGPGVQGVTVQFGYKLRSFCSHCGPGRTPQAWEHDETYYRTDSIIFGNRDGGYRTYKSLPVGGTRFVDAIVVDIWGPGCAN